MFFTKPPAAWVLDLLERKLKCAYLHMDFPDCEPQYSDMERTWEEKAWINIIKTGNVDIFSAEEVSALHWELAFWVMQGLYAHYRKTEPELTWEEFLHLTQGREEIREGASYVVRSFPEISRPDLIVWKDWKLSHPLDNENYAKEKALFQTAALPLTIPTEYLEEGASVMANHLTISLYIQKKKQHLHCLMRWKRFRAKVEAEPIVKQILSQQVRWMYALNPKAIQMLWESKRITVPPLRPA